MTTYASPFDVTATGYGGMTVVSAYPEISWEELDAAVDNKYWEFVASGGILYCRAVNDAYSSANYWMFVTRTGITAAQIALDGQVVMGGLTPASTLKLTINGLLYVGQITDAQRFLTLSANSSGITLSGDIYNSGADLPVQMHNTWLDIKPNGGTTGLFHAHQGGVDVDGHLTFGTSGAWNGITLNTLGGWVEESPGTLTYPRYKKFGDMVKLEGCCKRQAPNSSNIIGTLPSGYRPAAGARDAYIQVDSSAGYNSYVIIKTNGDIDRGNCGLSHIRFDGKEFCAN